VATEFTKQTVDKVQHGERQPVCIGLQEAHVETRQCSRVQYPLPCSCFAAILLPAEVAVNTCMLGPHMTCHHLGQP
jgi:hypothetical protein